MVKRLLVKHGPAIALVATLVGCGGAPPTSSPAAPDAFRAAPSAQVAPDMAADLHAAMSAELKQLLQDLALTDAQQASFKALLKEHLQTKLPELKDKFTQLKTLLQAEPFDAQALQTAITTMQQEHLAELPEHVQLMARMRDVLTASQRETVADFLEAHPGLSENKQALLRRFGDKVAARLELTETQRQAYKEVQELKLAHRDRMARMAHPAVARFMRDGDTVALEASLRSGYEAPPVEQGVAFLGSLSAAQRATLVTVFKELIDAHRPLFDMLMQDAT